MKLVRRLDAASEPASGDHARPMLRLDTLHVTAGSQLCRLHVWTESEWAELAESDRPVEFVYAPGLGWVGALPLESLN